ncbi:MAG: potassium channel family protein [Ignavibacteria bacterium]
MIKKISKFVSDHSQIALILSILLLIFFSPYYWDSAFTGYINFILMTLILLSAMLTLKKSSQIFKVVKQAGNLIIILSLFVVIIDNAYAEVINRILFILFFIMVAINLLVGIIKSREVDTEVIFSAVAVYVLFGLCGAILAAVVMFFEPEAFSLNSTYSNQFHQLLYFSFVTITTTGYGDILPVKPIARTLAIFLVLFGQLYLTVIIGILIGKYLSGREKSK